MITEVGTLAEYQRTSWPQFQGTSRRALQARIERVLCLESSKKSRETVCDATSGKSG